MLYAFVDESERDDSFYFLGAVIVNGRQRTRLTLELDAVVVKHAQAMPALGGAELHGSAIMRGGESPWRKTPLRLRLALYADVVAAIASVEPRIYIEGINIDAQARRGYPVLTPARELAFGHLFERINECCTDIQPEIQVIADEHHTAGVSRANFRRYQERGTPGYRSSLLGGIRPEIEFRASHDDRGLQASDMVTYLYNRVWTIVEKDERAAEWKARQWGVLAPLASWPNGRARTWP